MEIKRVLVKQSRFSRKLSMWGQCRNLSENPIWVIEFNIAVSYCSSINFGYQLSCSGRRVEPTTEEDDSLAAYCEWTFIFLNTYMHAIYCFYYYFEYSLLV